MITLVSSQKSLPPNISAGSVIEAQVKSYEEAMGTFKKLKKFNLNSMNAQDVDVKTPISDARKCINLMKPSAYLMENMDTFEFGRAHKLLLAWATFANERVGFSKPLVIKGSSAIG